MSENVATEEARVHRPLAMGAVAFAVVLVAASASLGQLSKGRISDGTRRMAQTNSLDRLAHATLRDARYRARLAAHHSRGVEDATRAVAHQIQRLGPEHLDDSPAPTSFEGLTGFQLPGFFSGPRDIVGVAPDPDASPVQLNALAWRGVALSDVLRTARAQVPEHTRFAVWVRGEGLVVHPAVPAQTIARWLSPHPGFGPNAISPFDPQEAGWLPQTVGPVGRRVLPHVTPLLDERGEPWAVVRCDVDVDQLLTSVGLDLPTDGELQPLVLDHQGRVLAAAPGAARALGVAPDSVGDLLDVRRQLRPFLGDDGFVIPGDAGFSYRGDRVLFAGAPVPGVDWTIGVIAPRQLAIAEADSVADAASKATEDLAFALLGFGGLFGLLAALAGVGFAQMLRHRLHRLAQTARAHAEGRMDTRVPADGNDEIGAIGLALNATALRASETVRRLEESRRRLSGLIKSMGEGLVITDAEDRVTFVNARFAEILERQPATLNGHFLEEFLVPQSLDVHRAELRRRCTGNSTRYEVTWRNVGGEHPQTMVSALPLFDADGRYTGSCAIVTDVTTRARAQEETARAEKLRALGEMAGGVAHDFNNVLTAVLGNAQYLLSETVDDDAKETLRIIETAAMDGTETVNRIRKFTKPSVGVVHAGPVDANSAAYDVLRMARPKFERVAEQRGVRYSVTLQREARRMIRGNTSELREVLLNLAYNALEAMPDGGTLTIETFDRGEDAVGLRVVDTGRGIPDENIDKVFDPFFSTKRGGRCSGLGLSICFGIVRAHGGRIEVRSEPGIGTTFTVVLPAFDEASDAHPAEVAPEQPQEPRVLLVSPHRRNARMLQRGLNLTGLHVAYIDDTKVATDLLSDPGIFNTLLVELDLGTESGWEFARNARRVRPDLRILLTTDNQRPVDGTQARNAGIDRVLCRPFDSEDVRGVILSTLARPAARLTSSVDSDSTSALAGAACLPQVQETWGRHANDATSGDRLTTGT